LPFDLFVRNGFTFFYLVQSIAYSGNKSQPLCDDFQVYIIRQTFDCLGGKLLVIHVCKPCGKCLKKAMRQLQSARLKIYREAFGWHL